MKRNFFSKLSGCTGAVSASALASTLIASGRISCSMRKPSAASATFSATRKPLRW